MLTVNRFTALSILLSTPALAVNYEVITASIEVLDTQGPVSVGTISSTTIEPSGNDISFSGTASNSATAPYFLIIAT